MDNQEIEKRFTYHPPVVDNIDKFSAIRTEAMLYAKQINALVPECREKSLAITKLEEVVMWANAAIARGSAIIQE